MLQISTPGRKKRSNKYESTRLGLIALCLAFRGDAIQLSVSVRAAVQFSASTAAGVVQRGKGIF
jgi:hypothetical protein